MLNAPSLTLDSWLREGWATLRANPKQMIGAALVLCAVGSAVDAIDKVPGGGFLGFVAYLAVFPVLSVGWCYFCVRLVRGERAKVTDILAGFSCFRDAWLTCVAMSLIVIGGVILLIVPGVIWGLRYGLCTYAVLDKRCSPREALYLSKVITQGHVGELFGVLLVAILLNLPGLALSWRPALLSLTPIAAQALTVTFDVVFICPFLGATFAAAYNSLVSTEVGSGNHVSTAPGS